MQVKAIARYLKISPKKMRLVANLIKGMDATQVIDYLKFVPRKASRLILKVLNSAAANAEHNYNLKKENLFIKEILVNSGPMLKRWRARAFGRAAPIRRKSSHLSIILEEKVPALKIKPIRPKLKESVVKAAPARSLREQAVEGGQEITSGKVTSLKQEFKSEGDKSKEIFDVRRKGKRRTKQHLDKVKSKRVGGRLRRIFRRKSI